MDEGIGKVLAELRRLGLDENTLIVFTSDNGGERFSDSWPLVGGKMDLTEGGIRVPYIVRWPKVVPPDAISKQLIITMDWMPTIIDAADTSSDPNIRIDGVSLLEHLQNPTEQFERDLFWRMKYRNQKAYRTGDWKYLSIEGNEYLFNLAIDARERANQALNQPEKLTEMREHFKDWEANIPPIPDDASVTLVYSKRDMP